MLAAPSGSRNVATGAVSALGFRVRVVLPLAALAAGGVPTTFPPCEVLFDRGDDEPVDVRAIARRCGLTRAKRPPGMRTAFGLSSGL